MPRKYAPVARLVYYVYSLQNLCVNKSCAAFRSEDFLLKHKRRMSFVSSDTPFGSSYLGYSQVAILKMAAIVSYSIQGGFVVSISTTVHPKLLK